MPMLEVKNQEYQQKIEGAIWEAIMQASLDPETRTASLLSGEIVQACLNMVAMIGATSKVTASPTRTREFCDDCAKQLRKKIARVKELQAAGKLDFLSVIHADERH